MNQYEEHIREQDMKAAIERSGYLLEHRVEAALQELDYEVHMSQAYPDEMTGKSRELDIRAVLARNCGPNPNDLLFPTILCECVNNSKPLVFFKSDSASEYLDEQEIKFSGFPSQILVEGDFGESWERLSEFLRLYDIHHFYEGPVSTQYCSFTKKRGSRQWMASHLDEHHDIFNTITTAIESETNHNYRGNDIDFLFSPISLEFYYPLMVLQGDLWLAEYEIDDLAMTKVDHVQYKRNHHSSERRGTYQIDVITESYLPNYLAMVQDEIKKISYRMKRNKGPIRDSMEALTKMLLDPGKSESDREILDYDAKDRLPIK